MGHSERQKKIKQAGLLNSIPVCFFGFTGGIGKIS